MNQPGHFAQRLVIVGIFFLFVFMAEPRTAYAGSTLTVNTTSDDTVPDNFLTLREAITLAAGLMERPLTTAEKNLVAGGCFRPGPPLMVGDNAGWIPSLPNAGNGCPNVGPLYSDNIVFASNVDVIDLVMQPPHHAMVYYFEVGCDDHINGDRGGGQKVTINGSRSTSSAALMLSPITCAPGKTSSNHIRNLIIRGFTNSAIWGMGVRRSVLEGLEIFENGENGIDIFPYTYDDGSILIPAENRIGGPDRSQWNFIHSNGGDGISLSGHPSKNFSSNNVIVNNFIGLKSASATESNGNSGHGISITDLHQTIIGGNNITDGNVVVGNGLDGIRIDGGESVRNVIIHNSVGVNGALRLGNKGNGIVIAGGAHENRITRNIIGANQIGVFIAGRSTDGNTVGTNFIGTDREGKNIGNAMAGVFVESSSNNIGTSLRTEISGESGNTIAFNGRSGVVITDGKRNAILSNSIFSNRFLGIDLLPSGAEANDAGDPDSGPNNRQNSPVITSFNITPSGNDYFVNVIWSLNSTPNSLFRIQFFDNTECDPTRNGEGKILLGTANFSTNASGLLTDIQSSFIVKRLPAFITATATNESTANTSEFSNCVGTGTGGSGGGGAGAGQDSGIPGRVIVRRPDDVVVVRPPGVTLSNADLTININATPAVGTDGVSITYYITVTNNGPSEARDVVVSDNLPDSLAFVGCVSNGECGGSVNNRTVRFASIPPNASATITITARVLRLAPGMQVSNTVWVNAQTHDPNPNNNRATATSTAPRLPF